MGLALSESEVSLIFGALANKGELVAPTPHLWSNMVLTHAFPPHFTDTEIIELAALHSALQQTRRRLLALSEHEPLPSATKLPPRAPKLPPPALDGSTDDDTEGSAEDTEEEKQVAEPHTKVVEMFECEFDCGFEHHDFAVAEAHERECPKRHEAAAGEHLDGPHAHTKPVNVFECEFECGFEHEDFAVAEAHEKKCLKRPEAASDEQKELSASEKKTLAKKQAEESKAAAKADKQAAKKKLASEKEAAKAKKLADKQEAARLPHAHQEAVVAETHEKVVEKQVAEPHKKVVEMFECEFDCGFEHHDFAVAEAHERECPKRHEVAVGEQLDGPHAHTKPVNVFECEFECGFEHEDFAVTEAHEKECPKRSEAVAGEASNMAPISAVKEEVASSSPSSRARDGSAHNALKAFAAKKS